MIPGLLLQWAPKSGQTHSDIYTRLGSLSEIVLRDLLVLPSERSVLEDRLWSLR